MGFSLQYMDTGLNGLISMLAFVFGVLYQRMERTLVNALLSTAYGTESVMKRGAAKLRCAGGGRSAMFCMVMSLARRVRAAHGRLAW